MDTSIVVAIVTTAGSISVALIAYVQNVGLKKRNKDLNDTRQKLETTISEIKLISTGMVVAYFYSFIKPLFDKISSSQLMIIEGEKKYKINSSNTKLELVIPKQLDKNNFDAANNFYKSAGGMGAIVDSENKVLYKQIQYRIDATNGEAVVFIDVPSILSSALQYYTVPMFESKKKLQELMEKEMNNFRSEISRMIENGDLEKKVWIQEYSAV